MLGCFSIQFPSNEYLTVTFRTNLLFIPTILFSAAPSLQLTAIFVRLSKMPTLKKIFFFTNKLIDKFMSILTCRKQEIWVCCLGIIFIRLQIFLDNIDRNKFVRFLRVLYVLDSFTFIKRSHNCICDSITGKYLVKGVQSCSRIKI